MSILQKIVDPNDYAEIVEVCVKLSMRTLKDDTSVLIIYGGQTSGKSILIEALSMIAQDPTCISSCNDIRRRHLYRGFGTSGLVTDLWIICNIKNNNYFEEVIDYFRIGN